MQFKHINTLCFISSVIEPNNLTINTLQLKYLTKNITSISYNTLNLPHVITFADGNTVTYSYDGAGSKLSVAYKSGSTITKTEYIGNKVYKNGTLSMILTEEGYVTLAGTTPTYYYHIKDHQGNNRVVINQSGAVQQANHYYPFGGQFGEGVQTVNQPYKYNGKEIDRFQNLDMYDYGARHYDAALGRWFTGDPLAEKYYDISPYVYVANNPVSNIDPDGRQIVGVSKKDAQNYKADIHKVLANEKFTLVRALIDVKGSTFKSIDAKALSSALDGVTLSADEMAYVNMVTNTINSRDIHKIEYLNSDFTSSEGATAFKDHMNKAQAGVGDMMLTPEGKLSTGIIDNYGGGLNVPTKKGSHSFIGSAVTGNERAITSGHELFGHGIPSAKNFGPKANNANAIRTDNLIRRLLGMPERDGRDHGGFKEGHITEPNKLPITQ